MSRHVFSFDPKKILKLKKLFCRIVSLVPNWREVLFFHSFRPSFLVLLLFDIDSSAFFTKLEVLRGLRFLSHIELKILLHSIYSLFKDNHEKLKLTILNATRHLTKNNFMQDPALILPNFLQD